MLCDFIACHLATIVQHIAAQRDPWPAANASMMRQPSCFAFLTSLRQKFDLLLELLELAKVIEAACFLVRKKAKKAGRQ